MKVFKMNEFDWVAAKDVTEAIEWYEENSGYDGIRDPDMVNPIECDLDAHMQYSKDIYNAPHEMVDSTFRELLRVCEEEHDWTGEEPFVILSTEY